ncbi:phosphoglycolate phosphatase [Azohydromonas sediminis]|uniref:phosphoglycolate phosphatase n=1 Tax=Azohydromonas sediminis TaxID=2259674 RepID=UPI000E64EAAB|nr:phosphoglycolate phosphatase [Azohydromonas sediminis]
MGRRFAVRAVLFDLDGTLADTAPDLGGAVNRMRARRGFAPLPIEQLRPVASSGARGMLAAGLGKTPADADYDALREEFLAEYASALDVHSRLFDGVAELLDDLQRRGLGWGIVTNKVMRFTAPVVAGLGLADAPVVVAGDTTPHAKPHPAPLLAACERLALAPAQCLYVGDDLRDIEAARAAGMASVAAAWGYLGEGGDVRQWRADAIAEHPRSVLALLDVAGAS